MIDITKNYKEEPESIAEIFEDKLNTQYAEYFPIYTDSAAHNDKIECGIFSPFFLDKMINLPKYFSINSAEAWAILEAINDISLMDEAKYIICTDSLKTLNDLNSKISNNSIVQLIKDKIYKLQELKPGIDIKFIWTPGHMGINGNEEANTKAITARKKCKIKETPVDNQDLKAYLTIKNKKYWQSKWERGVKNNYLTFRKNFYNVNLSTNFTRREQIKLTRTKIGHTNITHVYLMKKEDPPICEVCSTSLNIDHILYKCKKYEEQRIKENMHENSFNQLNEVEKCKNIISFLKNTLLFKEI